MIININIRHILGKALLFEEKKPKNEYIRFLKEYENIRI